MDVFYQSFNSFCESMGRGFFTPPFAAAAIVVVLILLWFLLRGVRLWYWKTNQQLDTLRQIDNRLRFLEEYGREKGRTESGAEQEDTRPEMSASGMSQMSRPFKAEGPETGPDPGSVWEQPQKRREAPEGPDCGGAGGVVRMSMSKSGRVYTEQELEKQIRE